VLLVPVRTLRGDRRILSARWGTEAFCRALQAEADVVIAGRACDTAIFAAVPALLSFAERQSTRDRWQWTRPPHHGKLPNLARIGK
jgi:hypothetical protein